MAPISPTPRRNPTGRRRGRPPGTTNAARAARQAAMAAGAASEPPSKKRRFISSSFGDAGSFLDADSIQTPDALAPAGSSRARALDGASPSTIPRRDRSARTRAVAGGSASEADWGTAAAVAASVKQAEDYKPREERSWEEFHPNLDIERGFLVLSADDVDGVPQESRRLSVTQVPGTPLNGSMTPSRHVNPASTGNTPNSQRRSESTPADNGSVTPSRRSRRPTRDIVTFYGTRPLELNTNTAVSVTTPRTPRVLPIHNQTPKERLDLKQPSYRKTNRIALFESKRFGQARYVDKAMSNVGYQESDEFLRPDATLIKAIDGNVDEADQIPAQNADEMHQHKIGRVEYDMDEQDDMWLEQYNSQRQQNELEVITREIFEITLTRIEKEWHALERRIPKPNPKPPQTHRPRSSSAAAVNGEPQGGEEPDSKCVICDDGDCENTNAIVFCDGCNLAVHQECYGVPFIPEGQWLCRKCQLCGRGVPTCIFCPNTDGAFKQTNSSKWAHLLCAMWIPEVSLGNHTFMEPVMDVEKVPKNRWKLSCYICHQKMGACIQCGNKNCYQAFHVTCARRARLYLKMKTTQGTLAVLDGSMILKAFCDRHCPPDYAKENAVHQSTRAAKKFYKKNMRGRIWANNHAIAHVIAAQHRNALAEHPSDESQLTGAKNSAILGDKSKDQSAKQVWKLPSGAPIIPQAVFEVVEASIQRFPFRKRKDFLSEACRYWTLKREARRGAALLKRLQLQMESFSSMELTRRNFATMGPSGKSRLARRIEFAENLVKDLELLKNLAAETVEREELKVDAAELEQNFVDECYFPIAKLLGPALEKAVSLDKDLFTNGLNDLQDSVEDRFYVTALSFAEDLGKVINKGIQEYPIAAPGRQAQPQGLDISPAKSSFSDIRERRKLGKRILKAVQPYLETALRVESEIASKPFDSLQKRLESLIESCLDMGSSVPDISEKRDSIDDTVMIDAHDSSEITVKGFPRRLNHEAEADRMDTAEDEDGGNIEVNTSGLGIISGSARKEKGSSVAKLDLPNGVDFSETPPESNSFVTVPKVPHVEPPTPPQSNGSLGKEPADVLGEGGILWYLKTCQPRGTSILGEQWEDGRDAVRMLSEDLTDMDEEELRTLGVDVDGSTTNGATGAAAQDRIATLKGNKSRKRRTSGRRR